MPNLMKVSYIVIPKDDFSIKHRSDPLDLESILTKKRSIGYRIGLVVWKILQLLVILFFLACLIVIVIVAVRLFILREMTPASQPAIAPWDIAPGKVADLPALTHSGSRPQSTPNRIDVEQSSEATQKEQWPECRRMLEGIPEGQHGMSPFDALQDWSNDGSNWEPKEFSSIANRKEYHTRGSDEFDQVCQ